MNLSTVTLKDGTEVYQVAFLTTRANLEKIAEKYNEAFQELVLNCRDSDYAIIYSRLGNSSFGILRKWELIDSYGAVHRVVKSIVLNSTEGDLPEIKLVDALKKV